MVSVVGATGGVGSKLVEHLVNAGARVRALARSRAKATQVLGDDMIARLDAFIEGDVSDEDALGRLLTADGKVSDVVVSCLGTPQGSPPCVRDGTESILKSMRTQGCGRLVFVSSVGVGDSLPQGKSMAWFFMYIIKPLILRKAFRDLDEAETICWGAPEGVKVVAVRPPHLTDSPGLGIEAVRFKPSSDLHPSKKASISRADVGAAMAALACDPTRFDEWAGRGVTTVVE